MSREQPRTKAAKALQSCLEHLAGEAERSALPLTAAVIALAMLSIEEELAGRR